MSYNIESYLQIDDNLMPNIKNKKVDKKTSKAKNIRNKHYLKLVYLFHILIVFPLFMFICVNKPLELFGYNIHKLVGRILLLVMGYSLLKSEITGNWNWKYSNMFNFNMKKNKQNATRLRIVYWLHIIIIIPLLLSSDKSVTDNKIKGGFCLLGIIAVLYHGYTLWRSEKIGKWDWFWNKKPINI